MTSELAGPHRPLFRDGDTLDDGNLMPRSWEFVLDIDRTLSVPPSLQIARALAADIQRGRLRPGDRLPGSRQLAVSLHVHRNTVRCR